MAREYLQHYEVLLSANSKPVKHFEFRSVYRPSLGTETLQLTSTADVPLAGGWNMGA